MTGETNEIRAAFAAWWASAEAAELRAVCSAQTMAEIAFARGAGYGADCMHAVAVAVTAVEIARAK